MVSFVCKCVSVTFYSPEIKILHEHTNLKAVFILTHNFSSIILFLVRKEEIFLGRSN